MYGSSLQLFLNYSFPWLADNWEQGNPFRTGTYQVLGGIHSGDDSTLSLNRGSLYRGGDYSPALNATAAHTDHQLPLHWQSLSPECDRGPETPCIEHSNVHTYHSYVLDSHCPQ